jgi:hypothetical protein
MHACLLEKIDSPGLYLALELGGPVCILSMLLRWCPAADAQTRHLHRYISTRWISNNGFIYPFCSFMVAKPKHFGGYANLWCVVLRVTCGE